MKVGDLVITKASIGDGERRLALREGVGVLFQDDYNLMILWPNGFIENSCVYFEHELEVVSESRRFGEIQDVS